MHKDNKAWLAVFFPNIDLVHTDLCGPISISARGGYEYFVTFIDDYSRFGYLYLMHHKSKFLKNSKI